MPEVLPGAKGGFLPQRELGQDGLNVHRSWFDLRCHTSPPLPERPGKGTNLYQLNPDRIDYTFRALKELCQ
jgi:hypothetical protein